MPRPLNETQEKVLKKIFYKEKNFFGRDRLFKLLQSRGNKQNISRRQVMVWLKKQEVHQLFLRQPLRRTLQPTLVKGTRIQVQMDLMDMSQFQTKKGSKWILTAIDVFSKKAWALAMKDKSDKTVLITMRKMVNKIGAFRIIRTDPGSEFKNNLIKNLMRQKGVIQVFGKARTPQSQGLVERFNGTLKRLILKARELKLLQWDTFLQVLVDNYNKTFQDTIKATPNEVDDGDVNIQKKTKQLIETKTKRKIPIKANFDVVKGDNVRVRIEKDLFPKGSVPNWSSDIFKVDKVTIPRKSTTAKQFKLKDKDANPVDGTFFATDILKIPPNTVSIKNREPKFIISKLVRPFVSKGKRFYETKWQGWKDTTEEPRDTLLQDAPKLVNAFEKKFKVRWLKNRVVFEKPSK